MEKEPYIPRPFDTKDIELPEKLKPLVEQMAKNVHEIWAQTRISQGWTYGPERDDAEKKHPCLVPYEQLPEEEKVYDRNTSVETLKFILGNGFRIILTLCLAGLMCIGCANKGEKTEPAKPTQAQTVSQNKVITVYLQPYNGFPENQLLELQADVQNCLDTLIPEKKFKVKTLGNRQLPANCFYQPRKRYRADSIIRYQLSFNNSNYIMGVLNTDISCDAHGYEDFGILGLGFCPGKSAVTSTFRVKPKSMFYKVVVHEFLHNLGLDHCPQNDRSCYMCDADKVPHLELEVRLCESCREIFGE